MYKFPEGVYCDVRIEEHFQTLIRYELSNIEEMKESFDTGAFIRVFDGERWFYSSTTEIDTIQSEIDQLAKLAKKNVDILENKIVKNFEMNSGEFLNFNSNSVANVHINDKLSLLKKFSNIVIDCEFINFWRVSYKDWNTVKTIISSKGTNLKFDSQISGLHLGYSFGSGNEVFSDGYQICKDKFDSILGDYDKANKALLESTHFYQKAEKIPGGDYTVVLSPLAAGIFAHESFGHKSEADFAIGDETAQKEWCIGKKVGSDILTITDTGLHNGSGYVPFDDEGNKTRETYLIKNGILSGRLHNAESAALLNESVTGNGRAVSFEFEPIVRMTSTTIGAGKITKEEIIQGISKGLLIETVKHGSGMSTFTLAPSRAYLIKDGKIDKPVKFSVITGNVMSTLDEIEAVSCEYKIESSAFGGCGKMEQFPLPVSFGGPYVKIRKINVQ